MLRFHKKFLLKTWCVFSFLSVCGFESRCTFVTVLKSVDVMCVVLNTCKVS